MAGGSLGGVGVGGGAVVPDAIAHALSDGVGEVWRGEQLAEGALDAFGDGSVCCVRL
jgi:hypothetical protein